MYRKSEWTVTNTNYYFSAKKFDSKFDNIIFDPLFKKIVRYLFDHKDTEIILRQIKATIPTDDNIELYLDKLIKYGLVERKNRRYTLTFPIYSTEKNIQIPHSIINTLQSLTNESSLQTNYFIFGQWLWRLFFEEEQKEYFFCVESSSDNFPLFRKREAGNSALQFVSIYQDDLIPLDFANYFNILSKRQVLPEQFNQLQRLIGDVDINYFITQIQKVIRSVKRNPSRVRKQTIFEEALLTTEDLLRGADGQLSLTAVCLDAIEISRETQHTLDKLKVELNLLWGTIEDVNQREYYKMQCYSILFTTCFPNQKSIQYFSF